MLWAARFSTLRPKRGITRSSGTACALEEAVRRAARIAGLIEKSFGGHTAFCQQFVTVAGDQFGSGWAWLVLDDSRLSIVATPNAETPLTAGLVPLLTIDVWEHAYYLDYQHRRLDYIAAFLAHLVNWDFANRNLGGASGRAHIAGEAKIQPALEGHR